MRILFFILSLIIPVFLIVSIYELRHVKKCSLANVFKDFFRIFILINLITIAIMNALGFKKVLLINQGDFEPLIFLVIISLIVGFIYLLLNIIYDHIFVSAKREERIKGGTMAIYIIANLIFFIGILAATSAIWAKKVYFDAAPDQIFITLVTPITGTDSTLIYSYIEGPLILTITIAYIFALLGYSLIFNRISLKNQAKGLIGAAGARRIASLAGLVVLISGLCFGIFSLDLDKIIVGYTKSSSFIEDSYVDPTSVDIKKPSKPRNLIHIYLESIENSFLDEDHGGVMKENLIPNLMRLQAEGISFSNLGENEGFGGPKRLYGASFSCGSIVSQFFGVPMRIPALPKQYAAPGKFLPGALGIGDLLNYLGYEQVMLRCGNADFGGLRNLFTDHGNFKIIDSVYAKEHGLIPNDYNVGWGYEDEKLYSFAINEMRELNKSGKPFHVIVENADTHNPGFAFDGDKPIYEATDLEKDYAKTIKFSEKMVYDFVKRIQAEPFYENTTIVIIGDHNSMDSSLFKDAGLNDFTRTTYNLIINPDPSLKINKDSLYNREWAAFDMMPTILASLGFKIEGDKLGLGTNLYSGRKTLFEEKGYDYVNDQLVYNSPFYNNKLAKDKLSYQGENLI